MIIAVLIIVLADAVLTTPTIIPAILKNDTDLAFLSSEINVSRPIICWYICMQVHVCTIASTTGLPFLKHIWSFDTFIQFQGTIIVALRKLLIWMVKALVLLKI